MLFTYGMLASTVISCHHLSVCPSVCPSVTSQCSPETAERRGRLGSVHIICFTMMHSVVWVCHRQLILKYYTVVVRTRLKIAFTEWLCIKAEECETEVQYSEVCKQSATDSLYCITVYASWRKFFFSFKVLNWYYFNCWSASSFVVSQNRWLGDRRGIRPIQKLCHLSLKFLYCNKRRKKSRGQRCFTKKKDVLPNTNHTQEKNVVFVPSYLDLDLWPSPSKSSEQGTKHVFCGNFEQIHAAVLEIFHYKNKKSQTDGAKNRTFRSSLHAITRWVTGRPRFTRKMAVKELASE